MTQLQTREEKLTHIKQLRDEAAALEKELEFTAEEKSARRLEMKLESEALYGKYFDIYVGTEIEGGPWFIREISDGEITIPRTNPLYMEFFKKFLSHPDLLMHKKICEELILAEHESKKYLEAVAKFEAKKENA